MKLITINLDGLTLKEDKLLDTLKQTKVDMALLTEVHEIPKTFERKATKYWLTQLPQNMELHS